MELYDYPWLPEDKQRVMHFRQKIPFGSAAAAERIACRTLPYLVALGVTPEMTGYYVLCRAFLRSGAALRMAPRPDVAARRPC